MVGTERLLTNRQRALEQRLGVGVATQGIINVGYIVYRRCDVRMVGAERFLDERQFALRYWQRLHVFPGPVELGHLGVQRKRLLGPTLRHGRHRHVDRDCNSHSENG